MSTVGRKLLSAIVAAGSKNELLKLKLYPELFKDNELVLYEFVSSHVSEHGALPQPDTIESKLGDVLTEVVEPISYYMKEVEKRYLFTKLKTAILQSQDALKEDDPNKAFGFVSSLLTELHQNKHRHKIIDFREAADVIHAEYLKQHIKGEDDGIYFGWPYLDSMSAGLRPGDFVSINGRPAAGKTFMLLYAAHYGWRKGKTSPIFISMEMEPIIIQQRLAAMDTSKALTQILKGTLSTKAWKYMMQSLEENKAMQKPFWVVDGNLAATPDDVIHVCRLLHPDCAWLDGGYLMKSTNPKMGKFERIGDNADQIKQRIAGDMGMPAIVSYQLNRTVVKDKKKDPKVKAGVSDIYGNDAIGQLSSLALALDQEETIETKVERTVDVMKGRHGEVGSFRINWNFSVMDFSQITEVKKEELQFIG